MERKKREGGGGGSKPSGLGAKIRDKLQKKRKDGREKATRPRSDHLWSRSPSPGDEGRPRGLKQSWKWVGFRRGSLGFSGSFLRVGTFYILGEL
jgi:hypothetical protein